jgi:hypothetical protein
MSLTRNIGSKVTVDLRYIGTLSRKLPNTFNINTPNFLTNGLKEAFDAARYGDDSNPALQLLDNILKPLRGSSSGAKFLRSTTTYAGQRTNLANGNYSGIASWINTFKSGSNPAGYLLTQAGLPDNFIVANPQFATANVRTNWGMANYHSMQAQVSLRPTAGLNFQLSYTWSKSLANTGASYTDPRNRAADYTLADNDRRHALTSYGTFSLPIGPNKMFLGKTAGVGARLLEGWQISWVANVTAGSPASITAPAMLYGTGVADLAGNMPKAGVYWPNGSYQGNYFGNALKIVSDPQANADKRSGFGYVTTLDEFYKQCTLTAAADANDNIILKTPLPGTRGNLGFNTLTAPMTWNVDMSLGKTVKTSERTSLSVRVDSTNIFNHPQPSGAYNSASTRIIFASAPALAINTSNPYLGNFATKVGNRVFQARIRFAF